MTDTEINRMTVDEFRTLAQSIVGSHRGWQSKLATKLGVHRATVGRWLSGDVQVPIPVTLIMKSWMADATQTPELRKSHPLSWREPRDVIPLVNFDFPAAHVRSTFDPDIIGSLTHPRMAGSRVKMSQEEIRDTLRSGDFSDDAKAYLLEVFKQCDGLDLKLFRHTCGASLYDLARAMIACKVRHPFVAEWMNCRAPNYHPSEINYQRWWPNHEYSRMS